MSFKRVYILFFLTIIFALGSYSQVSEYKFRSFSIKEGLSQSTVQSIYQDEKGFMWFGTDDGINRFDGRGFVVLKYLKDGKTHAIRGKITGIDGDGKGALFIANYGVGLYIYDINYDKVKSFNHVEGDKNSLISNYVYSVKYVNDTSVWISSDVGISCFNPQNNTFRNFSGFLNKHPDAKCDGVSSFFIDGRGHLWIGTKGLGLMEYIAEENRFVPFYNKAGNINTWEKNYINDVIGYKDGLLVVSTKYGLYFFDPQTGLFFEYKIHGVELQKMTLDKKGGLWIASRFDGLYYINKDEQLRHFKNQPQDPRSLPEDRVVTVFRDNMQSLWLGTRSKGVVQVMLEGKPFKSIYHVPDRPSIADNSVFAIKEDSNGEVWIGSIKGLTIWNPQKNDFRRVKLKVYRNMTKNFSVWSIFFDQNKVVWVGTNKGLVKYDRKNGTFRSYHMKAKDTHSLVNNDVACITRDKKGRLWVSTPHGVGWLNERTGKFKNYKADINKNNSLSHSWVMQIFSDSKGRLWFGTRDGLNEYNFEKDDFRCIRFSNLSFNSNNVLANTVTSITESKEGLLWTATESGIYVYDPNEDKIIGFVKDENGKFFDEFANEVQDTGDYMWVSTNKGLVSIDKKTLAIEAKYMASDGFYSDEFNIGPSEKLNDGYLLFGGVAGVVGFYPDKVHKSDFCPPIYPVSVALYGEEVKPDNKEVFQRTEFIRSMVAASSITLSYDEKMVTVSFAALDYTNPQRISYFYRILPVSDKWISLGERNFMTFINLNSGEYTLEVKATNGDGILCDKNIKRLKLYVTPPFWMEWRIHSLIILSVLLLIAAVIRHRVLSIRHEKEKLEEIVQLRTKEIQQQRNIANRQRDEIARQKEELQDFAAELENKVRQRTRDLEDAKIRAEESDRLKSAFLSNMSHEIRTPMNAILGFSELLLAEDFDKKEREMFARMVKLNGDALLKLLNDIIDISMIESGQLKFHFSDVKVCDLVRDIFFMFKNSKLYKEKEHVKLEIVLKADSEVVVNTDEDRLRQVITNLLNNALKFTSEGCVTLGCEEIDGYIQFYVSDTGIGIRDELMSRIFDRFYKIEKTKNIIYGGNGLGLTITKNIVEALDGNIWVESEVGKGTTFWFTVPK